jgi:hypothetical protein
MAKEKRTREERKQGRELRRDERRGERIRKAIAKSDEEIGFRKQPINLDENLRDPGYTKTKPVTVVMRDKTIDRLNNGELYTQKGSIEAYSKDNTQEAVAKSVRTQLDYKASLGEIDAKDNTQLANGVIQSQANSTPTAGAAIISAIGNNSDATTTDLNKLPNAATTVNTTQKQEDDAIANNAINVNNAVDAETAVDATQAETAVDGGVTPAAGATETVSAPIGGDGTLAVQQMQGGAATFDQGLNRTKVQDEVTNGAFQGFSNAPVVAIEKLGIQDYFPNAGENIAVGSYSGKYIGNTTIFAAPGARVPFGLYDARMRALKEAAADRQKAIDKIITAPQTAEQYQQVFNEYFFSGVESLRAKYGDDPNAILSSPEGAKFFANANAIARDYTKAVAYAESTLKTYADNKTYLPDSMRNKCLEVLYATGDDWKKAMNGEGSLINSLNGVLSYVNVMPDIEKYATEALKPENLTEMPMNLKTGGEYDKESFVAERENFFMRVRSGGIQEGSNQYVEGIRKYFTGDYIKAITAICAAQNVSEEQTQDAIRYFEGRIPKESIEFKYSSVNTNAMALAELAQRDKEWRAEQDNRKLSFAGIVNGGGTNDRNPNTGMTFNEEIAKLNKSGLKGAALEKKLEELHGIYMGATSGSFAKIDKNGVVVTTIPLPKIDVVQADPQKRSFTVTFKDPLTGKPVSKQMTAAQIAQTPPNLKLSIGGKVIESNSDYATIVERPVSMESRHAYYDPNGDIHYQTAAKLDDYDKSSLGRRVILETEKVQVYIPKTMYAEDGRPYQGYEAVPGQVQGNTYNISNPAGQAMVDERVGFSRWQSAQAQAGGQTTVSSGSTTTR